MKKHDPIPLWMVPIQAFILPFMGTWSVVVLTLLSFMIAAAFNLVDDGRPLMNAVVWEIRAGLIAWGLFSLWGFYCVIRMKIENKRLTDE